MATVPASTPPERREGSLSGARADFVAQLGRRIGELRLGLQALEADPQAPRPRDDLKRRFHALGSAARVLKFQALADELMRLEQLLARSVSLDVARLAAIRSDVDALMGLAWGEAADSRRPGTPEAAEVAPTELLWPATALVVGGRDLAEGLAPEEGISSDTLLDCERVENTAEALDMARAVAPDVLVLDADLPDSQALLEQLSNDPLTEPVPVVVVGTFASSERAARWVALGVARVVARPFSPRQLQEACASTITGAHQALRPEPFGKMTLEQLVDRLSAELKRGLFDGAQEPVRHFPVGLGDGHDVMAALWSAIVRIREITTVRSGGIVRFQQQGPEGAVAVASWGDTRGSRRGAEDERLDGRVVLVADDDPSVIWFLSGVLKAAGATVLEALDGETALRLAYRHQPEVVISDILMPKMDGFALCRALKRDVVLRDVPVILLSWKEDLLQRVRELGANADGYLRKEASAAVVLQRVLEVLRPRLRVEQRLKAGCEVRGRLDDLTPRSLLAQVAKLQPNARLSIRDAVYLYEIEMRGGAPRSATRSTMSGRFERGSGVFFSLLGVVAGRFQVAPSDAPLRGWLEGSLEEQMRPAVAQIRAAQRLLSGAELMGVQSVDIHLEAIQPYLESAPPVSRGILDRLAEGVSPRALMLRDKHSPRLLEDVLCDAILHGGVVRVTSSSGDDLLPSAVEHDLALLEQEVSLSVEPPRTVVAPAQLPAAAMPTPKPATTTRAPELKIEQKVEPRVEPRATEPRATEARTTAEPRSRDSKLPVLAEDEPEEGSRPSQGPFAAPAWKRGVVQQSPMESALLDATSPLAPATELLAAIGSPPPAPVMTSSHPASPPESSAVLPVASVAPVTSVAPVAPAAPVAPVSPAAPAPAAPVAPVVGAAIAPVVSSGSVAPVAPAAQPAPAASVPVLEVEPVRPAAEVARVPAVSEVAMPTATPMQGSVEVTPPNSTGWFQPGGGLAKRTLMGLGDMEPTLHPMITPTSLAASLRGEIELGTPLQLPPSMPVVPAPALVEPTLHVEPSVVPPALLAETQGEVPVEPVPAVAAPVVTPEPVAAAPAAQKTPATPAPASTPATPEPVQASSSATPEPVVIATPEPPTEVSVSAPLVSASVASVARASTPERATVISASVPPAKAASEPVVSEPPSARSEGRSVAPAALPAVAEVAPEELLSEASEREAIMPGEPGTEPAIHVPRETSAEGERGEGSTAEGRKPWGWVGGVMMLTLVGSFWALRDPGSRPPSASVTVPLAAVAAMSSPVEVASSEPAVSEGETSAAPVGSVAPVIDDVALAADESAPEGQGVLEVQSGRRDDVLVDRLEVGRGPVVKVAMAAGVHEVRTRRKGDEQPLTVTVRAGRKTRVDLRGPWRR